MLTEKGKELFQMSIQLSARPQVYFMQFVPSATHCTRLREALALGHSKSLARLKREIEILKASTRSHRPTGYTLIREYAKLSVILGAGRLFPFEYHHPERDT